MRQSAQLAAGGLRRCMQRTHPGLFEFQLAADFGAVAPSLPPSHSGRKKHKKRSRRRRCGGPGWRWREGH